jgi:hypothetical protein
LGISEPAIVFSYQVLYFTQLLFKLLELPLRTITSTETLEGLQVSAQLELPSITITFTETLLLSLQPHGSLGR